MSLLLKKNFKLGTTSFIYPDNIIPNVKKLGLKFDEIELLIFESEPFDVIPSKTEINELAKLSDQLNVSYNVHLPIDISITDPLQNNRNKAIETIKRVVDLFSRLNPTSYTLHLDFHKEFRTTKNIDPFKEICFNSLYKLLASGIDSQSISLETLDYPFEYLDQVIEELDLSVCVDIGHVIRYGYDLEAIFQTHGSRIPVVHLHGVDTSVKPMKDHLCLDKMDKELFLKIIKILNGFTGTVSIEVFNKETLDGSIKHLKKYFHLS